jgi:hypothetical protein
LEVNSLDLLLTFFVIEYGQIKKYTDLQFPCNLYHFQHYPGVDNVAKYNESYWRREKVHAEKYVVEYVIMQDRGEDGLCAIFMAYGHLVVGIFTAKSS